MNSFNTLPIGHLRAQNFKAFVDIVELDREYFPDPWTLGVWHDFAADKHRDVLVFWLESSHQVLSFILGEVCDETFHLYKILTDPHHGRLGLASELMQSMENALQNKKVKKIFLEVAEGNFAALSFYKKQGFKELCFTPNYYSSGAGAYKMERLF